MREVFYALQFRGQATPAGTAGNVLRAETSATSGSLTSTVGPDGVAGAFAAVSGGTVSFESEVTFTGDTSFVESGTIDFGADNRLRFSTVGSGYLAPSADSTRQQGAIAWRIDSGEGQFAEATGLITSNFFVTTDLRVVDHHFGVLLLP